MHQKAVSRTRSLMFRRSEVQAGVLMERFGSVLMPGMELDRLIAELEAANARIAVGDMREPEAMLFSQAQALSAIFTSLANRAFAQEHLAQYEAHMRLALKAQSQCRTTLEALAEMKNPRAVAFVKQANIAHGPQQVNNGAARSEPPRAHAETPSIPPSKLLEHHHGERLDFGAAGTASGTDPAMATVDAIHRAEDGGR